MTGARDDGQRGAISAPGARDESQRGAISAPGARDESQRGAISAPRSRCNETLVTDWGVIPMRMVPGMNIRTRIMIFKNIVN